MIPTKKLKPLLLFADSFPRPTDAVIGGNQQPIATAAVMGDHYVLDLPAKRRLVSYSGKVVDTSLSDAYALAVFSRLPKAEADDKLFAGLQADLLEGKTLNDSQMVWVHAHAINQLEKKYLVEGYLRPELASIFLILRDIYRTHRRVSTPVVRLINPNDLQTVKIFHRTELLNRNPYPGVVQVFANNKWCGQIKQLNPESSNSTSFCHTQSCSEWVETLLLRFADNPSLTMKEFYKLTGKHSVKGMLR